MLESAKEKSFPKTSQKYCGLWAFRQEEFERIPLEYIQNLSSPIPDIFNEIVQCNRKNIEF